MKKKVTILLQIVKRNVKDYLHDQTKINRVVHNVNNTTKHCAAIRRYLDLAINLKYTNYAIRLK